MKKIALLAATAMAVLPASAMAGPILTSATVTGPTGTIWNTTRDSFYTLFLQAPNLGNFINPNDEAISQDVAVNSRFLLAGDGFVPGLTIDSDPLYTLTLTFAGGQTLSGTYNPTLNVFSSTFSNFTFQGQNYSLAEFSFRRNLADVVSQYVATPGGDPNDYQGNFRIAATTAVPEPAAWALMIVGFGAVGGVMRRRSTKVAFAA